MLACSRSERVRAARAARPVAPIFRPKSAADYLVTLAARSQTRTRQHEALIEAFGSAVQAAGGVAATNVHPRDLTIDRDGTHWLVEAKSVGPNAELAVREAIGQLLSYRYFCYPPDTGPRLLALFNAPFGEAFGALLGSLGIEHVCRAGGTWTGSAGGLSLLGRSVT